MLSPAIVVGDPVPFDEALCRKLLLEGKAGSWEEALSLLPVERHDGIPLVSCPFPAGKVYHAYELVVKGELADLYTFMGIVKGKLTPGTGRLKAYRREYASFYTERLSVFICASDEDRLGEILEGEVWIGKKGKFGYGRLELEVYYPTEEVKDLRVRGNLIRPLPVEDRYALWMRKVPPYWRMEEREVLYSSFASSLDTIVEG